MSNGRDKSNKVVNVCHQTNPTQKNQPLSNLPRPKLTTQSTPPCITRDTVWSAQYLIDQRSLQVAIPHHTLWHMFRTAKITRSLSYRKCWTCSGPPTLNFLENRITRKTVIFQTWYQSPRTNQDSLARKIPCSSILVRRTTFKLVSTTRICAISMKKNFKYFTKLKR